VDELRLVTYPLTLGQGKKLFAEGTIPVVFMKTTEKNNEPVFGNSVLDVIFDSIK
jgi:hypothetical protein